MCAHVRVHVCARVCTWPRGRSAVCMRMQMRVRGAGVLCGPAARVRAPLCHLHTASVTGTPRLRATTGGSHRPVPPRGQGKTQGPGVTAPGPPRALHTELRVSTRGRSDRLPRRPRLLVDLSRRGLGAPGSGSGGILPQDQTAAPLDRRFPTRHWPRAGGAVALRASLLGGTQARGQPASESPEACGENTPPPWWPHVRPKGIGAHVHVGSGLGEGLLPWARSRGSTRNPLPRPRRLRECGGPSRPHLPRNLCNPQPQRGRPPF